MTDAEFLKALNTIKEAIVLLNKNQNINIRFKDAEYEEWSSVDKNGAINVEMVTYFSDGQVQEWDSIIVSDYFLIADSGKLKNTIDTEAKIPQNIPLDKKALLRVAYTLFKDYNDYGSMVYEEIFKDEYE